MANDVRSGRAFIEVLLRDKVGPGLTKMQKRLRGFSMGLAQIGGTILGAGGSLAAPFIPAIAKASDFEETMGKFSTVFGEQSEAVKAWGDDFANQVGRSEAMVAEFLAAHQDTLVPMGFDEETARETSKLLTQLGVDLASFNNKTDAEAFEDLQRALTATGETMQKYGVILNKTRINQELQQNGIDPRTASNQQIAMAKLAIIQRGTTAAQGDAIRTAGSFVNRMKALKAKVDDAAVSLGGAILPALASLAKLATDAVAIVGQWIEQNPGLIRTVAMVAVGVAAAGGVVLALAGAGLVLSGVLSGLAAIATAAAAVFGILVATVGAIFSPLGLVVVALVAGGAALLKYSNIAGQVRDFLVARFGTLVPYLREVFGRIAEALKAGDLQSAGRILWAALRLTWQTGVAQLQAIWAQLVARGQLAFADLQTGILERTAGFRRAWSEVWTGLASILDAVATRIRLAWFDLVTWLSRQLLKLTGFAKKALDLVAEFDPSGLAAAASAKLAIDVEATIKTLDEDRARTRSSIEQARRDRDAERAADLENQLAAQNQQLEHLRQRRDQLRQRAAEAGRVDQSGIAAAQRDLETAMAEARAAAEAREAGGTDPAGGAVQIPDVGGAMAAAAGAVTGTFSAAAAQLMGGGARDRTADETAANTRATAEATEQLVAAAEAGGITWGR